MKSIVSLFLLLLCFQIGIAQVLQDTTKIKTADSISSSYKENLDEYVGLRLDVNTNVSKFSFINAAPLKNFEVSPNQDYEARIAVNYKWLTLAFSFSPKIGNLNNTENEKGKTKITGFDFSFNLKKTQHRLFFTDTKGYYLSNSDIYRPELIDNAIFGKYAKLPDFKSLQLGSETFYFFNSKEFSQVFAKDKSEIQLKSAGSFVSYFGFYYSKIDGSNQDLPFLQASLDQGFTYANVSESYYGALGTGYAYNFVLPCDLFITTLAVPSVGLQYSRLQFPLNTSDLNRKELTFAIVTEASIGYNTKEWFTGLLGNYSTFNSTTTGNKLVGSKGFVTLFVGYRIPPPKAVKNTFDYINRQF